MCAEECWERSDSHPEARNVKRTLKFCTQIFDALFGFSRKDLEQRYLIQILTTLSILLADEGLRVSLNRLYLQQKEKQVNSNRSHEYSTSFF